MKKTLIHVDYTHDFVASNGALTTGEPGQLIFDSVMKTTSDFIDGGDYVVFAIDTHQTDDPFHPETRLYPPHNIADTPGHELYSELEEYYHSIKHLNHVYYMTKTRYSAFAGTDLEIKLRERDISQVHIIGVCTDICVLHTAIDAYNKGFKIVIHEHCVASFNQAGHEWALNHFKNCLGADII